MIKYHPNLSFLILRIIVTGLQLIITAYFFALGLAYIESFAQRNVVEDDNKELQKRPKRHWSENALALFTCTVATCSFLLISINLMNGLSTKWNSTIPDNEGVWQDGGPSVHVKTSTDALFDGFETSFSKLALAHLALSGSLLVTSLLGFLVGKNFTGLMSFFLGVNNIAASVFMQSLFFLEDLQECNGCLNNIVKNSFGNLLLLNLTSALGILAGIFHTASGCCAFFRLVAAFLKILLALPLMAIFAGIALTQRVINVVICRKVGSFDFYQYIVSSNLMIFVLGGPRKRR